eukprot:1234799-Pyramimonas_sp.AAC.1
MRGTNVQNTSHQRCEHPGFPGASSVCNVRVPWITPSPIHGTSVHCGAAKGPCSDRGQRGSIKGSERVQKGVRGGSERGQRVVTFAQSGLPVGAALAPPRGCRPTQPSYMPPPRLHPANK